MSDIINRADAEPIMTEEVREALMRLTMCAREECVICKYKDKCNFDFQYEESTKNMNTVLDSLMRSRCEVDAKSAEANHGLAKENSELKAQLESASDAYMRGFDDCKRSYEIELARSADAVQGWIPCSERLPSKEDCPMDCLVTRKSNFIGNYVDIAVAEANGTWTHEDWDAIVLGDVESGRKTGLISTREDGILAWMPLPTPYKGGDDE